MNKRIIRDDSEYFKSKDIYNLPSKTESLHPLNLNFIYNDSINPICLTKFQIDKNKNVNILSTYKCKNNLNNYKKNLFIPVIGLNSSDFLKIYSVESIDSLYDFVNQNLNKLTSITINRVINCWIRVNFETLKNYNNYLEKIYWIIIELIGSIEKNEKIIKNEIKNFIDYWINKHTLDEFNLNLFNDLIGYLIKKNLLNK